jgi:hypothetical protein
MGMAAPPDRNLIGLLELLLHEHPTVLSREEIIRELDCSDVAFDDSAAHLRRVGLAHELAGFYWATRSAIAADELKS